MLHGHNIDIGCLACSVEMYSWLMMHLETNDEGNILFSVSYFFLYSISKLFSSWGHEQTIEADEAAVRCVIRIEFGGSWSRCCWCFPLL